MLADSIQKGRRAVFAGASWADAVGDMQMERRQFVAVGIRQKYPCHRMRSPARLFGRMRLENLYSRELPKAPKE
jgi:hypothetical protein